MKPVKPIRCAIYTRVSTDQGLDMEFNSLDAQREASEAYIKSQAHEGWTCLKQAYDDGGYSGGSMQRPALQALLEDVGAKKLDVIVVYKVDRLTRSLADFAKLVDLFEANAVSFVSVTQSFNTTSSMGRLTLNVLLSFAQFEREVTGERIRDKVLASRKKGMWMGGVVPLGYRLEHKKLVIDKVEATKVRTIFALYLELKSLAKLAVRLGELGMISRHRSFEDGRNIGGKLLGVGALSHLLSNRVYIGEVRHHKQHYTGEHEPILDKGHFDAVQAELATRLNRKNHRTRKTEAKLKGLLYDSSGNRMIPSHANKAGVRYRYYQSWVLNHGQTNRAGLVSRVPAKDIEVAIENAMHQELASHSIAETLPIAEIITRVDVMTECLKITMKNQHEHSTQWAEYDSAEPAVLIVPWTKSPMRRRRKLMGTAHTAQTHRPMQSKTRSRLLQGIAQARVWLYRLIHSSNDSISTIALENGLSDKSVRSTLSLALLAPDIVDAAIEGRLPRSLTATRMIGLPSDWQDQRKTLGLI